MCPGRASSSGAILPHTRAWIVLARSNAETPVVHPYPFKSTDIVKGVPKSEVLSVAIGASLSSAHRALGIGTHNSPFPCVIIKLTFSGVIFSPAMIKSPSFSLFSSSMTIMIFP